MNSGALAVPSLQGMDPGWVRALSPVASDLERVVAALAERSASGERYLPPADAVLRAFQEPFDHVRVLIVGQDPYPTPGHSIGLAFAVEPHVRPLPRSLKNIYRELADDLGVEMPLHGDLRHWAEQGVLLLNRVLTVKAGVAGSHHALGWEAITARAITALVERGGPLVAILWGRHAQKLQPLLGDVPVIASAHPSPLSARNGFFGSRPFSRANALLAQQGAAPVEWTIPAQD